MTRAIKSLFSLDLIKALEYNSLLVILIPFFGHYIVIAAYNYIFKNKILKLHQVYNTYILYIVTGITILYGVLRNL